MSKLYVLIVLCMMLSAITPLYAQNSGDCKEIRVEARVAQNTVYLDFAQELNYTDFKLFLFAEKRDNNKLELTVKEITDLPKGKYLLVIQEKRGDKFCPKKINLKIE